MQAVRCVQKEALEGCYVLFEKTMSRILLLISRNCVVTCGFKLPLPSRQDIVNWIVGGIKYVTSYPDIIEKSLHNPAM